MKVTLKFESDLSTSQINNLLNKIAEKHLDTLGAKEKDSLDWTIKY